MVRRLPRRVQAQHRYFVYDNCCASHKGALRRFPHRVRHWTFVIDRTHYKNHTACHAGYNIDEFPQLKNVNSQQAEQINRSLRSLAAVLAHYKWETYLKVLELFFVRRNMRMKKTIKKEVDYNLLIYAVEVWHRMLFLKTYVPIVNVFQIYQENGSSAQNVYSEGTKCCF